MKRMIIRILLLQLAIITALWAENKIAQTGMQFLSIGSDGRGAALAGSMTARANGSQGLIYNPAAMAVGDKMFDLSASQNTWIADINHNTLTMSVRPGSGQYGVVGFSIMQVNYGDVEETVVAANDQGFLDMGIFTPTAMALGVAYAKSLTDKF